GGGQASGFVPTQTPLSHVSVRVQALPSVQPAPSGFTGFEQAPVRGSQTPAAWPWSEAAQATGFVPRQTPAWQGSVCVHAWPSLHALPSALVAYEQVRVAGSQPPAWCPESGGGQASGFAPRQRPLSHVSVRVQALPSLQALPSGLAGFEQLPV